MAQSPLYILDTNVILALARKGPLGTYIDGTFELTKRPTRCVTSIVCKAELGVLADYKPHARWGAAKRDFVRQFLNEITIVQINDGQLIDAYVEIGIFSLNFPGGAINMGKNDQWIAATARVAGAHLLTTDTDFDHLDTQMLARTYIDPAKHGKAPKP